LITRRGVLVGAIGARLGYASTSVTFDVPPHACDCHTHIFGDPKKYPLSPNRTYTPEPSSLAEMAAMHRALRIERVVIVTPSIYGTDNSATLDAMRTRGATARAVAVIDEKTPDRDLDTMAHAGFRGIRLNLATSGINDVAAARQRFQSAANRVERLNWHIQMYTTLSVISGIKDLVGHSPVPVVFDHFGGAQAALGTEQPGFGDLVDLVRAGKAYVKVSGAYRASTKGPDYADVEPLAKMLITANPDRILWGSDWPHPDSSLRPGRNPTAVSAPLPIDDGRMLNRFATWAHDPATRRKILVDNPAHLYGF
jgi:predicted TIM-barrel fold metal-dependent hydrolase